MPNTFNPALQRNVIFLESLKCSESSFFLHDDFKLSDLLNLEDINWSHIVNTFEVQKNSFEKVLSSIHFRRKKNIDNQHRERILKFLTIGYITTNDIRYFNEFLWFYKKQNDTEYSKVCFSNFEENLDGFNRHVAPYSQYEVNEIVDNNLIPNTVISINTKLKVALIGFPPFFPKIIKELKKTGFNVKQFFIPYHPKKVVHKILSYALCVKTVSILSGNRFKYLRLSSDYKNETIYKSLSKEGFDIGFHKLNFIIKNNIIDAFKIGLINDHWGALPFLRGKSTIAYSLLFGYPVVSTMHLIDEGIDTGRLVGFERCDINGVSTINGIKNKLRRTMPQRACKAIKLLSSPNFQLIENNIHKGLTYYEIHPWLIKFIEAEILKNNKK